MIVYERALLMLDAIHGDEITASEESLAVDHNAVLSRAKRGSSCSSRFALTSCRSDSCWRWSTLKIWRPTVAANRRGPPRWWCVTRAAVPRADHFCLVLAFASRNAAGMLPGIPGGWRTASAWSTFALSKARCHR